jgi:two-component system KDP operon response regulator KdpE
LLILDLGLPDMDGVDVIEAIRKWSMLPIIVLSARSQEQQKVDALNLGADDYLTKPFGIDELIARVRVALRHANRKEQSLSSDVLMTGGLKVDLNKRVVSVDGWEIALTPIQYRLLAVLAQNAGKVMTHRQILKEVWGPSYQDNVHYIRMYMSQLRYKLEKDPAKPRYLVTESGLGYRLKIQDE